MNAERRKALAGIIAELEEARSMIENARDQLDTLQSEERDAFDALPESLQGAERGQAMEAAADAMQEGYDEADTSASSIGDAIAAIEAASE
jgi:hypothetical protein